MGGPRVLQRWERECGFLSLPRWIWLALAVISSAAGEPQTVGALPAAFSPREDGVGRRRSQWPVFWHWSRFSISPLHSPRGPPISLVKKVTPSKVRRRSFFLQYVLEMVDMSVEGEEALVLHVKVSSREKKHLPSGQIIEEKRQI